MRALCLLGLAVVLADASQVLPASAEVPLPRSAPASLHMPTPPAAATHAVAPPVTTPQFPLSPTATPQIATPQTASPQTAALQSPPAAGPSAAAPAGLLAAVTLADIGYVKGIRFANLGGHHDLFVPLPQSGDIAASELVLALDDLSAHDAKRNLEVQVNDRTISAVMLDGKTNDRIIHVPLGRTKPKDGYLKLTFIYSGAATLDRCIDVRYVGDSLTIRPETAIEVDLGVATQLDVTTTAALMPRDVAIVLPGRRIMASEMATAATVARSLMSSGRHVAFYHGYGGLPDLAKSEEPGRWTRGVVLVGPVAEAVSVVDAPSSRVAGAAEPVGTLAAVRLGGRPALLVSDGEAVRAGRLFASPFLAATRGVAAAIVGDTSPIDTPTERVSFEQLAVAPAQAEVFGRADLVSVIDTRRLPPDTRPSRLLLDIMVAPDGAGERAVVSVFVNDRLLGSTVAATGEPTHLDLLLPDGLAGTIANVRTLVQRDSAQGDCRFEPQGYPAQILGSSSLVLDRADAPPHDFSDLASRFARGIELQLPAIAADRPNLVLGLVAQAADQLSNDLAPLRVDYIPAGSAASAPSGPFIAVGAAPPFGALPRVRFDQGRVVVSDRTGRTLLDLGGFAGGAVAQLVTAGDRPGVWIKPLAADGALPAPAELHLDHGDVAFIDNNGVALAMSTERDTVVRVSYPDHVSWLTVAERFRSWIIAGLWLLATAALLLTLQRMFRRRPAGGRD